MADTTVVLFGIRLEVSDDDLDELESRTHPMQIAAKRAGLESYWGKFSVPAENHLLFVCKLIGKLGVEDRMGIQINADDFARTAKTVSTKLRDAGISETALLHLEYQPGV